MKRSNFFVFILILAVLVTLGCSSRSRRVSSDGVIPSVLRVYTYDSFTKELQDNLASHLRQNFSVDLELLRFEDAGGLFSALYLERGRGKIDAFIGLDNSYLPRLYREDMLSPYKPSGLKLRDEKLLVDPQYRAIPYDYGGIVLNYDRQMLPQPPQSWDELSDPKGSGKIILLNPATSSPGRNFLLFTIAVFGEEGYLDFWKRIKPRLLTVAPGWSEAYGLFTQGEAPMVLSYDTSPAYHREFEKTDRYDNLIFEDQAYLQVEVAGIMKDAPNRKKAEALIDYLVSPEFQSLIPLNQFMYPVHPEAELPLSFTSMTRADNYLALDEERVAEKLEDWLEAWEEVMR